MNLRFAAAAALGMWGAFPLKAAFEERPFSARSSAVGESLVAVGGVDGLLGNPAALVDVEMAGVTLGHGRLYNDSELAVGAAAGAFPVKGAGVFGTYLTEFGSSLYREREFGVAWAHPVGRRAGAGLTLKKQTVDMERYGTFSSLQFDVGVIGRFHPRLSAGVSVKNVLDDGLGGSEESSLTRFNAGAALHVSSESVATLAVDETAEGSSSWRLGQEVWIRSRTALRAGFQTQPNRFSAGAGVRFLSFQLDYAFSATSVEPEQHFFNFSYRP